MLVLIQDGLEAKKTGSNDALSRHCFLKNEGKWNVSVCLVSQTYVVYPQRVAHRTDVGTAVARIELEYHVSRGFASRSPTYLLDGNHLAFRVFGILRHFARGECPG